MPTLGYPLGYALAPDAPTGNRLETLIGVLMRPVQRLENAMVDMLTRRTVDTATGVTLDVLGKIVGQSRNGLVDADYRRYIRARIATNRSTGKREEIIRIARLVVNDPAAKIYVEKQPPACFLVRIDNVAEPAAVELALLSFLGEGAGLGIRVLVQTRPAAPALTFKFAGAAVPGPGFDNTITPGTGGQMSDIREAV